MGSDEMTTVPDSNVPLARRAVARAGRATGSSAVARLLLSLLDHLSKLDRKLLLLLLASPISACIIPVGPEFQDPPGGPNSPPFLISESPDEGTVMVGATAMFVVTVGDFNVNDTIFVSWITEFPPPVPAPSGTVFVRTDEPRPAAAGSFVREPAIFSPNCTQVNNAASTHHITAAISDRPFIASDSLITESNVHAQLVIWTWEWNCPGTP
jgi:hypothetical protein